MMSPSAPPPFALAERLANLPYFQASSADRLAALAGQALCRCFAAQEVIFLEDQPSAGLWLIEQGRVKVFKLSPDGREHILHIAGPGDSFNDIPALDSGPNAANAVALSDVLAWMLPSDVLAAELRADHVLALAVIDILTGRVRQLVQQIEDLALCSVTARLARFLLNQMDNQALSGPGVTRATIAAHLATTPETVSRALRTLEDIGAIRFDRHTIVIVRLDLLQSVAMQ
ncbi:MAG: Crp/Fnr family transcriptional regulator [Anaerolineae bacterium]|nr:Crp/Fnr family transcriptional regulator [Anaerolineae bacterium]